MSKSLSMETGRCQSSIAGDGACGNLASLFTGARYKMIEGWVLLTGFRTNWERVRGVRGSVGLMHTARLSSDAGAFVHGINVFFVCKCVVADTNMSTCRHVMGPG